jgi:hypothetical protein
VCTKLGGDFGQVDAAVGAPAMWIGVLCHSSQPAYSRFGGKGAQLRGAHAQVADWSGSIWQRDSRTPFVTGSL